MKQKPSETGKTPLDYKVGKGRPPLHTRWKKGQSGRRPRARSYARINTAKMIEQGWAQPIVAQQNGKPIRIPAFEAIVTQLTMKAIGGSKRASKVLMRYQAFVARRNPDGELILIYGDAEYDAAVKAKQAQQ